MESTQANVAEVTSRLLTSLDELKIPNCSSTFKSTTWSTAATWRPRGSTATRIKDVGLAAAPREKEPGELPGGPRCQPTGHPAPFPYHQDTPTSATRLDAARRNATELGTHQIRVFYRRSVSRWRVGVVAVGVSLVRSQMKRDGEVRARGSRGDR